MDLQVAQCGLDHSCNRPAKHRAPEQNEPPVPEKRLLSSSLPTSFRFAPREFVRLKFQILPTVLPCFHPQVCLCRSCCRRPLDCAENFSRELRRSLQQNATGGWFQPDASARLVAKPPQDLRRLSSVQDWWDRVQTVDNSRSASRDSIRPTPATGHG